MRIGIDLGGTKIEGVVMAANGAITARRRVPTPSGDYPATLRALTALVADLEQQVGQRCTVGLGTPGALSPQTGFMQNCNSTCLNGQPLQQDIEHCLSRPVRMANDADCMALSEASDGAGSDARSVFGVILGTGVGGAVVLNGQLLAGPNAIAGEWGHNPLPWPNVQTELPGRACYCGLTGCIETWLSGAGLVADCAGVASANEVAVLAASQTNISAAAALERYCDRLARALAGVINILDPDVVVLAGGLSNISALYQRVPQLWSKWIFAQTPVTRLVPAIHGDSSGVRGAAWLWSVAESQ